MVGTEDNYRKIFIKGIKILSCALRKKILNRLVSQIDIGMKLVCIRNFGKLSLFLCFVHSQKLASCGMVHASVVLLSSSRDLDLFQGFQNAFAYGCPDRGREFDKNETKDF